MVVLKVAAVYILLMVTNFKCSAEENTLSKTEIKDTTAEKLKATKLPPCQACKTLVTSFKKGVETTSRGNFAGGDTAWEEKKLGSYSRSEIRLVEIQEKLCSDVERGESQCHLLAEDVEQLLEVWWFQKQDTDSDLFEWLCITTLKYCCPEGHYGVECKPCLGFPNKVCSGNGKCKGAGTRKGSGLCICEARYVGVLCNKCDMYHYEAYRDEEKLLCSPCHISCQGTCSQEGPKGCVACKTGWIMDTEKGCVDIDECFTLGKTCKWNEFCINNEGSFSCLECDKACNGCQGDGPDMCDKCAEGYKLRNNLCIDEQQRDRDTLVNLTRYMTYAGLCIATCIIFQKNMVLAGLIGLAVALYISVSEYMLSSRVDAGSEHLMGADIGKLLGLS